MVPHDIDLHFDLLFRKFDQMIQLVEKLWELNMVLHSADDAFCAFVRDAEHLKGDLLLRFKFDTEFLVEGCNRATSHWGRHMEGASVCHGEKYFFVQRCFICVCKCDGGDLEVKGRVSRVSKYKGLLVTHRFNLVVEFINLIV